MAFKIKQENYEKNPTTMQRRLMQFTGLPRAATRIEAHLAIVSYRTGADIASDITPEAKAAMLTVRASRIAEWKSVEAARETRLRDARRTRFIGALVEPAPQDDSVGGQHA